MKPVQVRHFAEYTLFRALVCVLRALPTRASVSLARTLAFLLVRAFPRRLTRYDVAFDNLRHAFGDRMTDDRIDRIILDMWCHLIRMVVELVQIPNKMRLYNCADVVTFRNRDETTRAMSCGRPVLMVGGHFGNWEIAMSTFGWFGFPSGVVARDLDNPYLNDWFERFRRHTGHRLISKNGGRDEMLAIVERGGTLGLLCDQDAGRKGVYPLFFGRPASTVKSLALLALQHRAVICVGYARRLPDDWTGCRWVRYEMGTEEIIDPLDEGIDGDVEELTQRFTSALERAIRRSPEQYFWVHRRWKSEPPRKRIRRAA